MDNMKEQTWNGRNSLRSSNNIHNIYRKEIFKMQNTYLSLFFALICFFSWRIISTHKMNFFLLVFAGFILELCDYIFVWLWRAPKQCLWGFWATPDNTLLACWLVHSPVRRTRGLKSKLQACTLDYWVFSLSLISTLTKIPILTGSCPRGKKKDQISILCVQWSRWVQKYRYLTLLCLYAIFEEAIT